MNSPKKTNYETRPTKFTERKMLLASLIKIFNFYKSEYQYIGFGGISFTDFKLFHKELHINDLYSIEGGNFSMNKLMLNAPFSFINIIKELSPLALKKIDLISKKSFIWLDYDGVLDNYFFDDITAIFNKVPEGSIFLITLNRELKDKETRTEYTKEQFVNKFGSLVPHDIKNSDFSSTNNFKLIRRMLSNHIQSILKDRNRSEESDYNFLQLFNILYQEFRGANMFTFGGVVIKRETKVEDLGLQDFDFINTDEETYKLEIPNLTLKEIDFINNNFDNHQIIIDSEIVSETDLSKYKKTYKFLPNFFDVRV